MPRNATTNGSGKAANAQPQTDDKPENKPTDGAQSQTDDKPGAEGDAPVEAEGAVTSGLVSEHAQPVSTVTVRARGAITLGNRQFAARDVVCTMNIHADISAVRIATAMHNGEFEVSL